jgi:hypothetical protein
MTAYDLAAVAAALGGLAAPAASTVQLGDRMQDLAAYLLDTMPGVKVTRQKSTNFGRSEETDIWLQHQMHLSALPFSDFLVPVECKNEATAISAGDITRFAAKIADSSGTDGLFIARAKLAGGEPYENAHLAIHDELVKGRRIVVLVSADLATLTTTQDLVDVIVDRFTELRTYGGYSSI